eukprot:TRINITY_DN2614_c0_g2_i1.p1 TRINITY_DN2614_c0_g2~~TRINITY_DN2614_c0_g2_i1.p1  ORF type:complete len:1442 (+),score=277.34 TRINITY_DN2614_c0_g2_i1:64-4389(+)
MGKDKKSKKKEKVKKERGSLKGTSPPSSSPDDKTNESSTSGLRGYLRKSQSQTSASTSSQADITSQSPGSASASPSTSPTSSPSQAALRPFSQLLSHTKLNYSNTRMGNEKTRFMPLASLYVTFPIFARILASSVQNNELDPLAKALSNVSRVTSTTHSLLHSLIQGEFLHSPNIHAVLRGNSLATKLQADFSRSVGAGYLKLVFSDLITEIWTNPELDFRTKAQVITDEGQRMANTASLVKYAQMFVDRFTSASMIEEMPRDIRAIAGITSEASREHAKLLEIPLIASFVLLRYFNPAIITPLPLGLVGKNQPTSSGGGVIDTLHGSDGGSCPPPKPVPLATHNLIAISKLLQKLAVSGDIGSSNTSASAIDEKDLLGVEMRSFLKKNQTTIREYLTEVARDPLFVPQKETPAAPRSRAESGYAGINDPWSDMKHPRGASIDKQLTVFFNLVDKQSIQTIHEVSWRYGPEILVKLLTYEETRASIDSTETPHDLALRLVRIMVPLGSPFLPPPPSLSDKPVWSRLNHSKTENSLLDATDSVISDVDEVDSLLSSPSTSPSLSPPASPSNKKQHVVHIKKKLSAPSLLSTSSDGAFDRPLSRSLFDEGNGDVDDVAVDGESGGGKKTRVSRHKRALSEQAPVTANFIGGTSSGSSDVSPRTHTTRAKAFTISPPELVLFSLDNIGRGGGDVVKNEGMIRSASSPLGGWDRDVDQINSANSSAAPSPRVVGGLSLSVTPRSSGVAGGTEIDDDDMLGHGPPSAYVRPMWFTLDSAHYDTDTTSSRVIPSGIEEPPHALPTEVATTTGANGGGSAVGGGGGGSRRGKSSKGKHRHQKKASAPSSTSTFVQVTISNPYAEWNAKEPIADPILPPPQQGQLQQLPQQQQQQQQQQRHQLERENNAALSRQGQSVVFFEGSCYVYGGSDENLLGLGKDILFARFNCVSYDWSPVSHDATSPSSEAVVGPGSRSFHTAVVYKSRMLVFGGLGRRGEICQGMYNYRFNKGDWAELHIAAVTAVQEGAPEDRHDSETNPGDGGGDEGFAEFISRSRMIPVVGAPPGRYGHTATVCRHSMYVFGGANRDEDSQDLTCLNSLFAYSFRKKSWTRVVTPAHKPPPRVHHSAVQYKKCIYVFGGKGASDLALGDLHKFSAKTNTWKLVADQKHPGNPSARWGHTAVVHPSGYMVLFGGCDSLRAFNDLYIFSFETSKWSAAPVFGKPGPLLFHSSVLMNGHMFVLFGVKDKPNGPLNTQNRLLELSLNQMQASTLREDFAMMVNNPALSDLTLILGGKQLYLHKFVLYCRCPSLYDLVHSAGGPASSLHAVSPAVAVAEGIEWDVMHLFVQFAYTDQAELANASLSTLIAMIHLCRRFIEPRLLTKCEHELCSRVRMDSALTLIRVADKAQLCRLKMTCLAFVKSNDQIFILRPELDALSTSVLCDIAMMIFH